MVVVSSYEKPWHALSSVRVLAEMTTRSSGSVTGAAFSVSVGPEAIPSEAAHSLISSQTLRIAFGNDIEIESDTDSLSLGILVVFG